jgi:hypothetical protein
LNREAVVALQFMPAISPASIGQRVTPAMATGVADRIWSLKEIVKLLDFSAKSCSNIEQD